MSITRAITEGFQSRAIYISGAREDIFKKVVKGHHTTPDRFSATKLISKNIPRITLAGMREKCHDINFKTLKEEYDFLINWVHDAGFPLICLCNLSRHGVDIPVVKAVIPGMTFGYGSRRMPILRKLPKENALLLKQFPNMTGTHDER